MLEPLELQHILKGNWQVKILSMDRSLKYINSLTIKRSEMFWDVRDCSASLSRSENKIAVVCFCGTDFGLEEKKETKKEFCSLIMFAEFHEAHNRTVS